MQKLQIDIHFDSISKFSLRSHGTLRHVTLLPTLFTITFPDIRDGWFEFWHRTMALCARRNGVNLPFYYEKDREHIGWFKAFAPGWTGNANIRHFQAKHRLLNSISRALE